MEKPELVSGLRQAISRGSSLEKAKASFINAGYSSQDVEDSSRQVVGYSSINQSQSTSYSQPNQINQINQSNQQRPISQSNINIQPRPVSLQQKQNVSYSQFSSQPKPLPQTQQIYQPYPQQSQFQPMQYQPRKSTGQILLLLLIIFLAIVLIGLLGLLAATLFFKQSLIDFLTRLGFNISLT